MNERMRQHARKFRHRLCGLSVRCMTVAALLALVATVTPWPTVRPAHADHTGMYVVCPDPILEGNSGQMQVRWRRHHSICATIFTYSGSYTADRDDYAWFDGVWMIGDDDSDSLWVPITTKEDSKPERDETFSIGYWDGGIWHGCVITIIDDDSPEITDVEISSKPIEGDRLPNGWTNKPNDWDTYRASESIDVTVTFDGPVEVDGSPVISLFLGDGDNNWRGARYHSGSGTDHLTFRYQVRPSDRDTDGVSVGSADVDDNREPTHGFSGTIRAKGTDAPAHLIHDGLASSPDHKVDGRPYAKRVRVTSTPPDGWSAYRANQIIEFSMDFDIDVEVNGEITMGFYVGNGTDGWRDATYVRGSGTDTLVFEYTVLPGDTDIDGVSIALGVPEHAFGGSGTITARGTDVEAMPYYVGTGPLADQRIDTTVPSITSVGIQSRPRDGTAYRAGEVIEVAVTFSEAVRIDGAPQVELDVGGEARQASLASSQASSETVVFRYTVAPGDADSDGIGIGANSLRLNGGGFHDSAGNAAGLSHAAVAADDAQRVDTSPPQG